MNSSDPGRWYVEKGMFDEVRHALSTGFRLAAYGQIQPGGPVQVQAIMSADTVPYFYLHESVHDALLDRTTLGIAAILCGLTDLHAMELERRLAAQRYLAMFFHRCRWVHEGVATAAMIAEREMVNTSGSRAPESADLVTDPSYRAACDEVLRNVPALARELGSPSRSNPYRLAQVIVVARGIAAMNPIVDDDFLARALGRSGRSLPEVSQVRPRFLAVRDVSATLVSTRAQELGFETGGTTLSKAVILATAMCRAADLSFSPRMAVESVAPRYVPELADGIAVVQPSPNNRLLELTIDYVDPPLYEPAELRAEAAPPGDLIRWIRNRPDHWIVPELTREESGPALLLHSFDRAGEHILTAFSKSPGVTRDIVEPVSEVLGKRSPEHRAVIVSKEQFNKDYRLRFILAGIPRRYVRTINYPVIELVRRTAAGLFGEVSLFECEDIDGLKFWELGPARRERATLPLSPELRVIAWVIRNGYCAILRWLNFNRPLGGFEWTPGLNRL